MRTVTGAYDHVQQAMDAVERAQRELDRACQLLCPVRGGLPTYTAVMREHERTLALCDRVRKLSRRAGLSLDSEAL